MKQENINLNDIEKLPTDEQIAALSKLVSYHNKKYFIDNQVEITDQEFDKITERLKELDPTNHALFELVGELGNITHTTPMLSIEKKYTHKDVVDWVNKIEDANEFIIEPKYDGMAARYKDGKLSTRGNGVTGEDITHRLENLNIQGKLVDGSEGEILIPKEYFETKLATTYKNSRNAAVGIVKAKKLDGIALQAITEGGVHFVLYDEGKQVIASKEDLQDISTFEEILEEMFLSDYQLDGIVIKVKDQSIREKLGLTNHHHKWQIAYKLVSEVKQTTVTSITDQVGRTGRITSVAQVEPIELSGATITNITLHNVDYIEKTGIGIGSTVEVTRAGEVIPYITRVLTSINPYKIASVCPTCSTKLTRTEKFLECPNKECPDKISQSIEYFFKTLGAEELGLKTVEKFIKSFNLKSIQDFYTLTVEQISCLDGFGTKSANNIVSNIQNTLNGTITDADLLASIGINGLGKPTAKKILKQYSIQDLPTLTTEKLIEIDGFAEKKAATVINGINEKYIIISDLLKLGLKFKTNNITNKLLGKKFAITGKKESYSRDELIKMIENNGGVYKTSITKELDYLIAGEDAGSKLEKANKAGVKIINEAEFISFL